MEVSLRELRCSFLLNKGYVGRAGNGYTFRVIYQVVNSILSIRIES